MRSRIIGFQSVLFVVLMSASSCKESTPSSQSTSTTNRSLPTPPTSRDSLSETKSGEPSEGTRDGEISKEMRAEDVSCPLPKRPWRYQAPGRIVAIGDVHGDLAATKRALRLAGAIDASDQWIGGNLHLVQTGDILDRGDDEQEILDLFESLTKEAEAAGGAIHQLHGNHELMNAMGDFRYVTKGGYLDFSDAKNPPLTAEARARAFFPGGHYARKLSDFDMVRVVGDSVFVHGGVRPPFTASIGRSNWEARCFLQGMQERPPREVLEPEGPLWTRAYSGTNVDCEELSKTLEQLSVKRMVVGHTPQLKGITSACDGKVWRIDTGMASYYGGPTEVLEITDSGVRTLKAD